MPVGCCANLTLARLHQQLYAPCEPLMVGPWPCSTAPLAATHTDHSPAGFGRIDHVDLSPEARGCCPSAADVVRAPAGQSRDSVAYQPLPPREVLGEVGVPPVAVKEIVALIARGSLLDIMA